MSGIPEISSYLPPFANKTVNPVVPPPILPSIVPKTEVHQISGGMQSAQAYNMAPNSSELVLEVVDDNLTLVWFLATDATGNKSIIKAFPLGEEYVPPKPVTLEDLMEQMQTMNERLKRVEETDHGKHNFELAIPDQPSRSSFKTSE